MPNKTIYVSDGDVELFQRAQELAGNNLSSAIAQALRRFVETQEAQMQGLEEITVRVDRGGGVRYKRFRGRQVALLRHRPGRGSRNEVFTVYRTAKDAFAVHRKLEPDWGQGGWSSGGSVDWTADWADWSDWSGQGTASSLAVYESMAALREQVPPELADLVEENTATPEIEELDI